MNWKELKESNPLAAQKISEHLEACECGENESVDKFTFLEKNEIVRAVGPNDDIEGVPPLWFIPGKFVHSDIIDDRDGYCTGDPDERECKLIEQAGFDYDWREYGVTLNSYIN